MNYNFLLQFVYRELRVAMSNTSRSTWQVLVAM